MFKRSLLLVAVVASLAACDRQPVYQQPQVIQQPPVVYQQAPQQGMGAGEAAVLGALAGGALGYHFGANGQRVYDAPAPRTGNTTIVHNYATAPAAATPTPAAVKPAPVPVPTARVAAPVFSGGTSARSASPSRGISLSKSRR